jgi:hypothetical protein
MNGPFDPTRRGVTTVISIRMIRSTDEEDSMISQERANPPAGGQQPGKAEGGGQTGEQRPVGQSGMPFDDIDEALEETMIASDPPALTPQTTIGPPDRDVAQAGADRSSS